MAAVAGLIFCLLYLVPMRTQPVSVPALLQRASLSERAVIETSGKVVHRSVVVEKRDGSGRPVRRERIDVWQQGGRSVKRVFDQRDRLVGGRWERAEGTATHIYRNAKLQQVRSDVGDPLADDVIWQLTPSVNGLARIIPSLDDVFVEQRPDVYVLHYENSGKSGNPRLVNASLTLRRSDLRAVEQTLRVDRNGEVSDYRFVETAFELCPVAQVAANVFNAV
jgi:hypothetical protein